MISNEIHKEFQKWHLEKFGWRATSRSSASGQSDYYEHPFTNGAWKTWLIFEYDINLRDQELLSPLEKFRIKYPISTRILRPYEL